MQQTMIMASSAGPASDDDDEDAIVVTTPLDAIIRLESRQIRTVVLSGSYARNGELAECLGELYPSIRIERDE
jgi:hypothetical protein